MAVLQISGVWLNKSPAPIFNRQQPRSRASSSTVFAAATAAPPPQSPSTIQIVGGNTPGWYGNGSLRSSNKFEGCQEEFDWIDLDADLYHWTKTLRPVQWYPGHIAKTEKELKEQLKLMDVVIEVRDARIPMSTSHPQMDAWLGNRKRILVLNREDMISTADRNAWATYYANQGTKVVFSNGKLGMGALKMGRLAKTLAAGVNVKRKAKGLLPRPVRAGIVGYPNVGKSSLINRLLKRCMCPAAPRPGVTRQLKWVRFGTDLELLDSPGIIPMRISDIDKETYNPGIKCDCSYNNRSTCHITQLKVYALDAVGVMPDELWNFTFLINLNLAQNYFSGPLPSSIGNLINMQYLSLAANALSGELPKELGNLTNLISLSFGENNFTGPLPSELGSLTKLEELYVFSSGVSGGIPPTFANLQNLRIVWASDTKLTGRIPDFIGNWSYLEHLSFQGNSFEGPIPNTFSNLTSVTDLRISDLSNGSSSLEFITKMKSLRRLILRNNNITGSIPSNIGKYQNLTHLDLSFNNLTGQIPNSLFNLTSLSYLFLGNNKLVGILPTQKSASLLNIDLSYNELSGTFPLWVNQPKLQFNLVFNNFTIESSNNSLLPSRFNCLQRGFPCYRSSLNYFNFSINCGGPQLTDSNQILYESDNETLGPATYYVNTVNRWAVSNVGLPIGIQSPQYTSFSSSLTTNTVDAMLFQTARTSAGSLRYYGLGLENGFYTVKLQFAEIAIKNPPTWKSRGKRIFDIFIQGNLVSKDFDIRKEAGGTSFGAVIKNHKVQVSENYLEIHLFWAGKGTCCIPEQGTYGPSISAISATPDFIPIVTNNPPINPSKKKNRTGLMVWIGVPVAVLSFLSVLVYCFVQRRNGQDAYEEEFLGMDARPYTFSYAELRVATDEFNPTNKLGEGGFGPVYKGTLSDGRVVAVKQLSVASHQGKSQFVAEIATISAVLHRNLVKLHGCCIEGDKRLLVYEYLENKSLDQALFGKRGLYLDWPNRYGICLGVARGLTYLHEESPLRIVHRDVKAGNILLDSDLNPKISDFGLAKLFDDKKTHLSTLVAGTIGYLSPEYAMRGHLSEKADVFSFGVVALEIISGRSISDSSLEEEKKYLLEWAWQLHEDNRGVELVDSSLSREFNENEVKRLINVALLCTQTSPTLRPSMSRVVAMLLGDIEVSTVASRPEYLTNFKCDDITTFTSTQSATTKTDHSTP